MDFTECSKVCNAASMGTQSELCLNDESDEDDDPIRAYFKQRARMSTYSERNLEDCASSIGLIDVDIMSLFGDEEEIKQFRFSDHNLDQTSRYSQIIRNKKESDFLKMQIPEVESELDKQRVLAQKTLQKFGNKSKETYDLGSPEKKENAVLSDISSKLMNLNMSKSIEKDWFQPNFSPKTPRHFNDELSSFGDADETLPADMGVYLKEANKRRQSLYAKKVNSMFKETAQASVNSEMKFERQTKEEQINRFEEDEKKFKLENSGLLHNSQISQFSGITAGDIVQWQSESSNSERENKNLSIGQFFNLRSDRVSSLVGSPHVNFETNSEHQIAAPTLSNSQRQSIPKREGSFSVSETPHLNQPKMRRCVSTDDLKPTSEVAKSRKYPSDSRSERNSTLLIREILAEMESGLSGREISEMLLTHYGRRTKEGKENEMSKADSENQKIPKSSSVLKREGSVRPKGELRSSDAYEESKNLPDQASILCIYEEKKEEKGTFCDLKPNETTSPDRNNKPRNNKLEEVKHFYSSTPRNQDAKSESSKFRKNCSEILMRKEDWEPPKVNSVKPNEMSRSECAEENEKTILVNSTGSSEPNQKNSAMICDTFTIEDTIVAGDLTVLSQRIEEMKRDSVCIVRSAESKEPFLLNVIQELADLPKGSLDCSALTPLLRDQFPELLSNFPAPSENSSTNAQDKRSNVKVQDALIALPGSWVKLPEVWGIKEKIYACPCVEKNIAIPIVNASQKWLLASIESVELVHPRGKNMLGERKGNEWWLNEFVIVSLKETIIPPDNSQSLKVLLTTQIATKFELLFRFRIKEVMNGEVQSRNLRLSATGVDPGNYIKLLPNDLINFGVIADQCFDERIVQISFDGSFELPLTVYIEEDEAASGLFILKPYVNHPYGKERDENMHHHVFREGEKQILEFGIVFRPNSPVREESKTQNFRASLVVMIGSKTDTDGILRRIPITGSVGFSRFLCVPSCSPLVFKASEEGQSVTRSYPLKNVGSLSIEFTILLLDEDHKIVEGEDVFLFPKSFYLSKNEETNLNITFIARGSKNLTKRYLRLQIKPNGKINYEIELIGITTLSEYKPSSRSSGASVSTKSTTNLESVPIKLLTTHQSLSWTAVPLEKEARQTFQIKSLSSRTTSVRINLEGNLESFKLVNENGEKVQKLRKVLKPDSPCSLTVVFRPDVVGRHTSCLTFEISHSCSKKKILLSGIGGIPNVIMKNVKSDLNGCKILKLSYSPTKNLLEDVIEFKNQGRIPAFIVFSNGVNDFSLCHNLSIDPHSVVVYPNSTASVKISQKLKNDDLKQLLSNREIAKIATLCLVTGDEPSRLRMKKLVERGHLQPSERLNLFTAPFFNEKEMTDLKYFKDPPGFESDFLKSLKVHEIAVVVERNGEIPEPSILEETSGEFFSFVSDRTVISREEHEKRISAESNTGPQKSTSSEVVNGRAPFFSAESLKSSASHKRVTKWLETLECV